MKKTIHASIALLLLATTSFPVLAQPKAPSEHVRMLPGPGAGVEMILRHADRLDLTADQEMLLGDVRDALAPLADILDRALDDDTTFVERLENRIEAMRTQADVMESALPSIEAFLDSLTEEQRALIEQRGANRHDGDRRSGERSKP